MINLRNLVAKHGVYKGVSTFLLQEYARDGYISNRIVGDQQEIHFCKPRSMPWTDIFTCYRTDKSCRTFLKWACDNGLLKKTETAGTNYRKKGSYTLCLNLGGVRRHHAPLYFVVSTVQAVGLCDYLVASCLIHNMCGLIENGKCTQFDGKTWISFKSLSKFGNYIGIDDTIILRRCILDMKKKGVAHVNKTKDCYSIALDNKYIRRFNLLPQEKYMIDEDTMRKISEIQNGYKSKAQTQGRTRITKEDVLAQEVFRMDNGLDKFPKSVSSHVFARTLASQINESSSKPGDELQEYFKDWRYFRFYLAYIGMNPAYLLTINRASILYKQWRSFRKHPKREYIIQQVDILSIEISNKTSFAQYAEEHAIRSETDVGNEQENITRSLSDYDMMMREMDISEDILDG